LRITWLRRLALQSHTALVATPRPRRDLATLKGARSHRCPRRRTATPIAALTIRVDGAARERCNEISRAAIEQRTFGPRRGALTHRKEPTT
jgi:hypothetical protein